LFIWLHWYFKMHVITPFIKERIIIHLRKNG
jgi:hypothetical protein